MPIQTSELISRFCDSDIVTHIALILIGKPESPMIVYYIIGMSGPKQRKASVNGIPSKPPKKNEEIKEIIMKTKKTKKPP
ncbi:hypothetical protein ACN38_g11425 [Penicillium nordicum]|uniref:Uncharacterized protein n=1 Tax=Penicillium nordicum TaxID=229535 RepID=A0A0M9WAR9_9EURO|nr:hypothetical protein ACN38_g11425 [Penicillium nordicum]